MGKAFVAKLARQGARDPEALAAWIGRKKHGKKAFGKLTAKKRKKGPEKSTVPAAGEETAARASLQSPEERRTAGIASIVAANARAAEQARQENAQRRARNAEALQRINTAPGKVDRKAMTPEERRLVNYEGSGAALQADAYERLRPFEDESAQANRLDVLKSRAFHKARAERIKNGWSVPGEEPGRTVERNSEPQSVTGRQAGARARLQDTAARRQAARENRPEDVTRDVATVQRAAETYRSNLGRGRISHVSDEKLAQLHALVRRLALDTDPDMFDRQETKALTELQSMVLREVSRRRSQR